MTTLERELNAASLSVKSPESERDMSRLPGRKRWVVSELMKCLVDARKRAKQKGIQCTIEYRHIYDSVVSLGCRCWLTGIQFKKSTNGKNPYRPSLDRINPEIGYTPENTRIVACCVNLAMNEWGVDILKEMSEGFVAMRNNRAATHVFGITMATETI